MSNTHAWTLGAGEFAKALSKAMFDLYEEDVVKEKARLDALVNSGKMNAVDAARLKGDHSHLKSKCRSIIPEPSVLCERLEAVVARYATALDPVRGKLFTEAFYRVHQRQLKLIDEGRLSGAHCQLNKSYVTRIPGVLSIARSRVVGKR